MVNAKFISTDGQIKKYSNKQICPLYKDDILMVMSDLPNGRALAKCFLVDEDDKFTLNQRIGAFTVRRHDLINTKYLYYVLNRNSQLLKYDNGADQTNLRKNEILNILIHVPSIEETAKDCKYTRPILIPFATICPRAFRRKLRHAGSSMNIIGISYYPLKKYRRSKEAKCCAIF